MKIFLLLCTSLVLGLRLEPRMNSIPRNGYTVTDPVVTLKKRPSREENPLPPKRPQVEKNPMTVFDRYRLLDDSSAFKIVKIFLEPFTQGICRNPQNRPRNVCFSTTVTFVSGETSILQDREVYRKISSPMQPWTRIESGPRPLLDLRDADPSAYQEILESLVPFTLRDLVGAPNSPIGAPSQVTDTDSPLADAIGVDIDDAWNMALSLSLANRPPLSHLLRAEIKFSTGNLFRGLHAPLYEFEYLNLDPSTDQTQRKLELYRDAQGILKTEQASPQAPQSRSASAASNREILVQ